MASTKTQLKAACKCCQYQGCDANFTGCGCTFHVRCLPPSVVRSAVRSSSKANDKKEQRDYCQSFTCPFCHADVNGVYLFPLSFDKLEKAIYIKSKSSSHQTGNPTSGSKRKHDANLDEVAFSVYSKWRTGTRGVLVDREKHRTGRWTDSEMAFVDHIVTTFEDGKLPVAEGVKLNTLLCDLLQCKSSRLTKKMKNAKLSTRAFKAASGIPGVVHREDCQILSALQEKFLGGRPTEPAQLELQFNVIKQWRSYFANFCMQAGYMFLDSKDWISSIEELETRASAVEEKFKKVRKRSISKALSSESKKAKSAKAAKQMLASKTPRPSAPSAPEEAVTPSSFMPLLEEHEEPQAARRPRTFSEDFDNVLEDLARGEEVADDLMPLSLPDLPLDVPVPAPISNNHPTDEVQTPSPSNFLDVLRQLMETPTSPYHYADIWVPSFVNNNDGENIQLLNAGYATRKDVDGTTFSALTAFGEYSKSFTFKPGHGLEGSVFSTGKPLWNFNLPSADQAHHFTRASGARSYGLKAGTGIPLNTEGVGRMVVVFYSCNDIVEDTSAADQLARELTKYAPEPKWKLVIDINRDAQPRMAASYQASSSHVDFPASIEGELLDTFETSGVVSPSLSSTLEPARPTSPLTQSSTDSVENEIISLMGDEAANLSQATASSQQDTKQLLAHFMTIRLLFLRPSSRRSSEENESVEILKGSYLAFRKGGSTRTSADLAKLLVRDWVCMKASSQESFSLGSPTASANDFTPQGISLLRPSEDAKKPFVLQPRPTTTKSMDGSEARTRLISVSDVLEGRN